MVQGDTALHALDPGGIDVMAAPLKEFTRVLTSENHTVKRALTDPRLFSGIGNAYSDEILHRACMSPVKLTSRLTPEEIARLHDAIRQTMLEWIGLLREAAAAKFPEKVTAFREGMAVHGRYGQPCPRCGTKIQRIRYADNETNYCPVCQTGGKLLADRGLSRLLREDWPRTLEELEGLRRAPGSALVSPSGVTSYAGRRPAPRVSGSRWNVAAGFRPARCPSCCEEPPLCPPCSNALQLLCGR